MERSVFKTVFHHSSPAWSKIFWHRYQFNRYFSKCFKVSVAKLLTKVGLEQNIFCYRNCLILKQKCLWLFHCWTVKLLAEVSQVSKELLSCKEPCLKCVLAFYTCEFLGYSSDMLQDTEVNHHILCFLQLDWIGQLHTSSLLTEAWVFSGKSSQTWQISLIAFWRFPFKINVWILNFVYVYNSHSCNI